MSHDGHQIVLVADECTVEFPATITEDGDVKVGDPVVIDWGSGNTRVYCNTCQMTVRGGDDGLAEDWQVQ